MVEFSKRDNDDGDIDCRPGSWRRSCQQGKRRRRGAQRNPWSYVVPANQPELLRGLEDGSRRRGNRVRDPDPCTAAIRRRFGLHRSRQHSSERDRDRSQHRRESDHSTVPEKSAVVTIAVSDSDSSYTDAEEDDRGKKAEGGREASIAMPQSQRTMVRPTRFRLKEPAMKWRGKGGEKDHPSTGQYVKLVQAKKRANKKKRRVLELAREEKWAKLAPEEVIRKARIWPKNITEKAVDDPMADLDNLMREC